MVARLARAGFLELPPHSRRTDEVVIERRARLLAAAPALAMTM